MAEILLRTKLFIPPLRLGLVARRNLIERLNQGLHLGHKLTLISAPAGFGKTTLASEWVTGCGRPAAWLSLDEGDNDPSFLAYLVAALRTIAPNFGEGVWAMLYSSEPVPTESVLTALLNEISTFQDDFILVLDDYHLIDAQAIDDALPFLLEHLPSQMHLVIVTREDPQLPLSRLRARGQLTELRATDLRFTLSEAAEFLNQVMNLNLAAEDVAALDSRTEGWIAGLQLAAISMQGHREPAQIIKSFSGSHRFVLDYLIEEVLEQQSTAMEAFLLQTALLDKFNGSLCDSLTGRDDGQETLEELERANLFIVPLDGERRWYRYHHLFADLLRQRLHQTSLEQIPTLHRKASEWHEQNGFDDEAIEYALRANEFERAAQLIEDHVEILWRRGEQRKLGRWLDRLPEETFNLKPHILIFRARTYCSSGQLAAAERAVKAAENALGGSSDDAPITRSQMRTAVTQSDRMKLLGRAAATRALICSYQGDVPGIIAHAQQALEYLPIADPTWRRVTAMTLGNAHGFKGNMNAAYEARVEASRACEAAGDIYFGIIANLQVAITLREQGRLQQTIEICRQQLQFAVDSNLSQTRTVGWLLAVWGETLAELNDLDEAIDRARQGFKLTERSGDLQMLGWSFMCLIRILFSRGDLVGAENAFRKMEKIARDSQLPPWIGNQVSAWRARLWLAQDNLAAASLWAQDLGHAQDGEPLPLLEIDFFSLCEYLILARILMARGQLDASSRLLQQLREAAEAGGRVSKAIEIMILQALVFDAGGEPDRALFVLAGALDLGEAEGFVRIFADEGRPVARLLYKALNRGIAPGYARRLLAALAVDEAPPHGTSQSPAGQINLVEPLSEREIEVLQHIAGGLTNRDIAERLYLSLNTVKAHTRNIYGKLGVHSRTQAVAMARALDILPVT